MLKEKKTKTKMKMLSSLKYSRSKREKTNRLEESKAFMCDVTTL